MKRKETWIEKGPQQARISFGQRLFLCRRGPTPSRAIHQDLQLSLLGLCLYKRPKPLRCSNHAAIHDRLGLPVNLQSKNPHRLNSSNLIGQQKEWKYKHHTSTSKESGHLFQYLTPFQRYPDNNKRRYDV